jgi:hypothetical protein
VLDALSNGEIGAKIDWLNEIFNRVKKQRFMAEIYGFP